jgi:hypothetical protein
MTDPTKEQLAAIADALYRVDAPRYGNDVRAFETLGIHERLKFEEMARVAIAKWLSLVVDTPA